MAQIAGGLGKEIGLAIHDLLKQFERGFDALAAFDRDARVLDGEERTAPAGEQDAVGHGKAQFCHFRVAAVEIELGIDKDAGQHALIMLDAVMRFLRQQDLVRFLGEPVLRGEPFAAAGVGQMGMNPPIAAIGRCCARGVGEVRVHANALRIEAECEDQAPRLVGVVDDGHRVGCVEHSACLTFHGGLGAQGDERVTAPRRSGGTTPRRLSLPAASGAHECEQGAGIFGLLRGGHVLRMGGEFLDRLEHEARA